MEYQKILHPLDNTPNQPSKSKSRPQNLVKINDDAHGKYSANSETEFNVQIKIMFQC